MAATASAQVADCAVPGRWRRRCHGEDQAFNTIAPALGNLHQSFCAL
jgi:hypothetical protein